MWPVACAAAGIVAWWAVDADRQANRNQAENAALAEVGKLTKMYAENVGNHVRELDQSLTTMKFFAETSGVANLDALHQSRKGLVTIPDGVRFITIDQNGLVTVITRGAVSKKLANDPEIFKKIKGSSDLAVHIEQGRMPLSQMPVVRLLKRVNYANGEFRGVVAISAFPDYLSSFYDKNRGPHAEYQAVALSDSRLLLSSSNSPATRPERSSDTGLLMPTVPIAFPEESGARRFSGENFKDKRSRIVGWHKVPGYSLTATVGLDDNALFAGFKDRERRNHGILMASMLVLLPAGTFGTVAAMRRARTQYRAEEARRSYRIANEGALEGFYTVEPLFDNAGTLIDFLLIDCNERGANLAGMTAKEWIGKKGSETFPASGLDVALAMFKQVLEMDYIEGEKQTNREGPFLAEWMHYRMVREGDSIAVTLRDITESKRLQEQIWQTTHSDALTELPNRNWLLKRFPAEFDRAKEKGQQIGVLYIDIDDFKAINSTLGHAVGDHLLRTVGQRLQSLLRPGDHIVRVGGDEFAVILYNVERCDAEVVIRRLMDSMTDPFRLPNGMPHRVTLSIGVSRYPDDGDNIETLLRHADVAIYVSKAIGKARHQFFQSSLLESVVTRFQAEDLLRVAIEQDQFIMYYQPRVDALSGEIVSMEALVRLNHSTRGLIQPSEFIGTAETTGLILQIGEIVIQKACQQLAIWREAGVPLVPVSVNVSAAQFVHGMVKQCVVENLKKYQIPPELLELELTESCMMGDPFGVVEELAAIQKLGIKLLLDDFGTGYSSLSQLKSLKLDVMKIDRSFTLQLDEGEPQEVFFQAMMTMAKSLNMRAVAEGVETVEQLSVLRRLGCEEIQGYLASRPVPAEDMAQLLQKRYLLLKPLHIVPKDQRIG